MKNKISIALLLISIVSNVYSQNAYSPNKIIPPSPTAAALGAYGDVPISYFTGTPNISIPIFEIKTNDFSLPIDLSYNASSIRVAQDASWVGLGWSLNAGGVITRSIRGLDDLNPMYEGYYYAPALPPNDEENNYSGNHGLTYDWSNLIGLQGNAFYLYMMQHWDDYYPEHHNYFMNINFGKIDSEPDIYYYNFGGYTGNFVMGKKADGSPIIMSEKNNLKFEFIESVVDVSLAKWKVTAPDGTLYYFNTTELNQGHVAHYDLTENELKGLSKFQDTYNPLSVSSWYLDKIQPIKGGEIKFNYDPKIRTSLSLVNSQKTRYDRISINDDDPLLFDYTDLSRQTINDIYLKSIEYENGKIEFVTNNRYDIEGRLGTPQRLEFIKIYDKNTSLIKEFVLNHDYFDNNYYYQNNRYAYLRLKLNTITEYGNLDKPYYPFAKSLPYIFTYNNPNNLPSKYSKKIDSWGFYNPAIPDVYLDNEIYPTLLPKVTYGNRVFTGVERKSDETGIFSQAGMLKSITYPTGGSTKFTFEPNQYRIIPADIGIVNTSVAYAFSNDQGEQTLTSNFSLTATSTVKFNLYFLATYGEPISETQILGHLKNSTGQILNSFSISNPEATVSLASGNYFIEVIPVQSIYDYNISLNAYKSATVERHNRVTGGNRIKEIKNYNSDDSEISFKKFIYTNDGSENGISSGGEYDISKQDEVRGLYFHMRDENGVSGVGSTYHDAVWSTKQELYLVRKSTPVFSLGLASQSGFIGYDKVYVLEGNNGTGGITKYSYFSSAPPFNEFVYPIVGIPLYRDPLIGKLKSVEYLNSNKELLESQEYIYTQKAATTIKGLKISVDRPSSYPAYHFDDDGIKFYDNISKWYALTSKITTKKLNNNWLTTQEQYSYDNPSHMQLTKTVITNSEGNTIETKQFYPEDISTKYSLPGGNLTDTEFSAINNLKGVKSDGSLGQNRIVPIQSETYENNTLLSRERTLYKNWNNNNLILPELVQSSKGTAPLETRMEYLSYYSNGNIKEVAQKDGTHSFYIWGYNNQYPVAKVENATEVQITGLNLDMGLLNSNSTTDSAKQWELQKIRDGLPQAMVSTYTYKPLVGITSMTDPKGYTIYYEYDSANRLKQIKDQNGKIISANQYHYKQ